jgi:hypothetical protein
VLLALMSRQCGSGWQPAGSGSDLHADLHPLWHLCRLSRSLSLGPALLSTHLAATTQCHRSHTHSNTPLHTRTHSYPSDDINKFLWMVRIGGGVFPEIKEPAYLGADGEARQGVK